jgi:hypothetical protein
MERKYTEMEKLSESRFGSIILLFRIAGISFNVKNKPTIYTMYGITAMVCIFSTFVGMMVEVYIRRDNLRSAMTTARALPGMINIVWIWCYCR